MFALLHHAVDQKFTPQAFMATWRAVEEVEAILPAMLEMAAEEGPETPLLMPRVT